MSHLIRIVQMQNPAPTGLDLLVALPARRQTRVHVDIVAGEIQTDQSLEQDRPPRKRRRKEHEQAGRRAAVGYHVEDGAEGGGLVVPAGSEPVSCVEDA
jgi:hypothetical protein